MSPIPNRVRELRTANEWTQAELADRLGVTRQTIISVETGKYEPSLGLAFKIAKVFERRIEEIFEAQ